MNSKLFASRSSAAFASKPRSIRDSLLPANLLSKARSMLHYYPYYGVLLRGLPYAAFRRITRRKCRGYTTVEPFVRNKRGLEIGGPSPMFREGKLIPVYSRCQQIDSCNFSNQTLWSHSDDGQRFGGRLGEQYVAEACDLSALRDATYDFVLASHVLEHIANPLKALQEWVRVLVPEGVMLVIVPDKRGGFDHRRPFTSFDHMVEDFDAKTAEDDLTHLSEILELHDLRLDPPAGTPEQFRERCLRNASLRAMHHHVFSREVLCRMFEHLHLRVLMVTTERPNHIVALAQKA